MNYTLTIIGGGLGNGELLTDEAKNAIAGAEAVYTTPRLAHELRGLREDIQGLSTKELLMALEKDKDAAVIVSGDVGFYSLSRTLQRKFGETRRIRRINGISSLQYFCARLGVEYDSCKIVSTHGRKGSLLGPISYNHRVFALTSGNENTKELLLELADAGLGEISVAVGENLGGKEERIVQGSVEELLPVDFSDLHVLLLENSNPADTAVRLRDEDFIRGSVPMTKEAVRALSVYQLEIEETDIIYDIGSGTGSVSVALARRAREGLVYAVERKDEAVELLRENIRKFGTYNIVPMHGNAVQALQELPPPDKVFIGGSGGKMTEIISLLTAKETSFTLCATAVTIETAALLLNEMESMGFRQVGTQCVNLSVSRKAGAYNLMTAQNPVYIIAGRWEKS